MIGAKRQSVCKHIIATRLAEQMGKLKIEHAIDDAIVEIFTNTVKIIKPEVAESNNFLINRLFANDSKVKTEEVMNKPLAEDETKGEEKPPAGCQP